jgi:hypothetical protein
MRRTILALIAAVLVLNALPAAAAPPVSCEDQGREHLTTAGLNLQMAPPSVAAYELAAAQPHTKGMITSHRSAPFPFVTDFAPADAATLSVKLDWTNPGDFDVFLFDDEGTKLASGEKSNIDEDQSTEENFDLEGLEHCQLVTLVVRNWTGAPNETLKLTATVTPSATKLACGTADPAPNCAGKAAGQAPDASPADMRKRLYLGGDPGQLSMAHGLNEQTANSPFHGTLSEGRPMNETPNSYTRPVAGFRDQYQNPFVPHFTTTFAQPRDIDKDVEALLWISSPTLKDGGTLFVDLFADGSLVSGVEIPGAKVPESPTKPLAIRLPVGAEQAVTGITKLTLQLGTTPAVSTGGPGNPSDAVFTIHYGGTQFPSRIALK